MALDAPAGRTGGEPPSQQVGSYGLDLYSLLEGPYFGPASAEACDRGHLSQRP